MKTIRVLSAKQLDDKSKKSIETFFIERNAEQLDFVWLLDESLIAGITVIDGNTVYDGSFKAKLESVKHSLR